MAGLTTLTTRNQLIDVNETVQLVVQFTNQYGVPTNLDAFPSITISSPTGLIIMGPTSAGVMQLDVGKYQYNFTTPFNGPYGIYNDIWAGLIGGTPITNSLQFVVVYTELPSLNSDGYLHLGDEVGFNYSQNAISNVNKMLKILKARLNNNGKAKSSDSFGNVIYVDCNIFSDDMLITFLANALSEFNSIPYFTFFTMEDTIIINQFMNVFVERATIDALASQALIEKGRSFSINDSGVSFTPPDVSELLNSQYGTMLTQFNDKLKRIKDSFRHAPIGLGTLRVLGSNPAMRRLRHLRARQIY
jgi:hypothetical protein